MASPLSVMRFVSAMFGFILWAAHFLFVYVLAALACARGFASGQVAALDVVTFAVVAATVLALVAVGVHALALWRARQDEVRTTQFLAQLGVLVDLLAVVAILMTATALIVPACG